MAPSGQTRVVAAQRRPAQEPARGIGAGILALAGRHVAVGTLALALPNGDGLVLRGPAPGPDARVEMHSWRALIRIALSGSHGLAAGYAAGEWDSPDPAAAVSFAAANMDVGAQAPSARRFTRPWRVLRHALRVNTRGGARRNIAAHYDLGNDFYRLWLDAGMTYSAALFPDQQTTLEQAQDAKYRRILDRLGATPGDHVLEIGCGWGGFAEMAARDYGLRVTALTLSQAQFEYSRARLERAGLSGKVDVRLMDYRDVAGRYDHVVSIEMMEAVGEAYWPVYFSRICGVLNPGGRAVLQVITIDRSLYPRYRMEPDFIQNHVFPGGMLPTGDIVTTEAGTAGLVLDDDFRFGRHYARTLREWRRRFCAASADVSRLGHDQRFRRFWTFYLAYCEGGFATGRIDVRQMSFVKPR
ncbi:MAG: class I SAM-dependent methyltransferase [Alphaproteobacteria bacterium]